jgi:electron transport complex, RnfABCDGE type, E subunit
MGNSKKLEHIKNLTRGIFIENPLFIGLLGTCPALAVTKSVEAALGMGILFLITLIGSNLVISMVKKIIPEEIKIPCYIVIIASFVTIIKMLCESFLPELYSTLGVFISLIVVNCIVLGRAEAFASKNTVYDSFLDAIGMGVGYTLALVIMAFIREILGTGGISMGTILTFIPYFSFTPLSALKMSFFQLPAGAFLVLGLILMVIAFCKNRKNEHKQVKERLAKKAAAEALAAKLVGDTNKNVKKEVK